MRHKLSDYTHVRKSRQTVEIKIGGVREAASDATAGGRASLGGGPSPRTLMRETSDLAVWGIVGIPIVVGNPGAPQNAGISHHYGDPRYTPYC